MHKMFRSIVFISLALMLVLTACGGKPAQAEKVTITVWDYYTDPNASPINPAVAAFEQANPNIKVDYQIMDWQTTLDKLNVALSGGTPPDMVSIDMTWLPRFAALGAFTDLKQFMPDGKLNGLPLDQNYSQGSLEAMTYDNKILTMMYDFDVYAMYYRADLFAQKGIAVPTTWDELVAALKKLGEGDLYKYQVLPDTFHVSQFIYENGGSLLSSDNKTAVFNSPEAIQAFQFYTDLVMKNKVGIAWTADQGEAIQGIKDGRIAVFSDGPYFMGLMKSGAPEMAGKWRVATHPTGKNTGSYLGGTGLVIPAASKNQAAAWKFIQFLLQPENALGVYKYAGAAPALLQALNNPEVNKPDDYFGGQKPFEVFREAMKTAHPFPYVRQWSDIDSYITNSLQEIMLNQIPVEKSVNDAAAKTNDALSK
jgi:ABC-type glycerol-3-phosphate transport system substrate-binding protein